LRFFVFLGRLVSERQVPKDDDEQLLRPPQFTLRTLVVAVSLVAVLCSLVQWVSPAGLLALVLLVAVLVCHVAGNAIGTRLRQLGMERARQQLPDVQLSSLSALPSPFPSAADAPPATPNYLSQRRSLGWPSMVAGGAGLVLGGVGGALGALGSHSGARLPEVIVVGAIAFSVLGGLAAFAVAALVQVGLAAVRQALASMPAETSRPRGPSAPRPSGPDAAR
jgi:hypothetical protein